MHRIFPIMFILIVNVAYNSMQERRLHICTMAIAQLNRRKFLKWKYREPDNMMDRKVARKL